MRERKVDVKVKREEGGREGGKKGGRQTDR